MERKVAREAREDGRGDLALQRLGYLEAGSHDDGNSLSIQDYLSRDIVGILTFDSNSDSHFFLVFWIHSESEGVATVVIAKDPLLDFWLLYKSCKAILVHICLYRSQSTLLDGSPQEIYRIPELASPSSDLMLSSLQRMPPPRKKERVLFTKGSS
jgi:hypothetical protein